MQLEDSHYLGAKMCNQPQEILSSADEDRKVKVSLNASTVFPREFSESGCPHRGEQQSHSPADNDLCCSLAHV